MALDRSTWYARLSFAQGDDGPAVIDDALAAQLTALLAERGLVAVKSENPKPYLILEIISPAAVAQVRATLKKDAVWQDALAAAGRSSWRLRFHAGPVGPGRKVVAGQGRLQGDWRTYSIHDGLPSTTVNHAIQGRDGLLWFVTHSGGVCSFDGAEWTIYTVADGLVDDRVWTATEDRNGDLWFGSEDGLSCFAMGGESPYFTTYTDEDGLPKNHVFSLQETPDGIMWANCYDKNLVYAQRGGVESGSSGELTWRVDENSTGEISGLVRAFNDRQGRTWVTDFEGVLRYITTEKRFVRDMRFSAGIFYQLIERASGDIWLSAPKGLYRAWSTEGDKLNCELIVEVVSRQDMPERLLEDRQGRLWVTTNSSGLMLCERPDETTPIFRRITTADGLANNQVLSLMEDRQGSVWVCTYGGGVSRLEETHIQSFTADRDGLAGDGVMDLLEDRRGDLWVTTWDGVSRYDGRCFHQIEEFIGRIVIAVKEDRRGYLWFAVPAEGCCFYDGRTFTMLTEEDGLIHYSVSALLVDSQDRVWVGTAKGLSCYSDGQFVNYTTAEGLVHNPVVSLAEDRQGRIWIGTWDGGLSCFDGERFSNFTTDDGLAHDHITYIMEDRQGLLWLATWGGGLSRYDGASFSNFTTNDGLAHDRLRSVYEDQQGHLWIATFGGGVSRYDGRVFQTISRQDGLADDTAQRVLQDRDGDCYWIATEGGLTRYRPQDQPPRIALKDIVADRHYGAVDALGISVSQDFLLFQFQGVSWTTGPDRLAYGYRLVGHQDEWQYTYERQIEYRGLGLGDYTFEVRAIDRDLNYSSVLQVALRVEPDRQSEALVAVVNNIAGEEFIGGSRALRQVQTQLAEVALTAVTVLLMGETGTGKGLAAYTLHKMSERRAGPFIQVNCGAIPEGLVESELFGHERGAFTGADALRLGKAELAAGGTLFLDEIGDLAADSQVKLLRLLEEQAFERVGGNITLAADARVVSASNRDLRQMVADGQFREDLYFRLSAFVVRLPLLRDRREDVPQLVLGFMEKMAAHLQKPVRGVTSEAMAYLRAYDWPGNVRELQHVVQRAVIVCRGAEIDAGDIALEGLGGEALAAEIYSMEAMERHHIQAMLEKADWIIGGKQGAAVLLEMNESTLRSRMKKLKIERP